MFGDADYAFEELVAETGAATLSVLLGVSPEPRPDHAQYLNGWLKAIKDNPKAVFTAFTQAKQGCRVSLQQAATTGRGSSLTLLSRRDIKMDWIFNDGGRKQAGYLGRADDCVCRAIAIAAGLDYEKVYQALAEGNATERKSKSKRTAREGIHTKRKWFKDYMVSLGFTWVPTMQIGSGCKVHLKAEELPAGRLVCNVSSTYVQLSMAYCMTPLIAAGKVNAASMVTGSLAWIIAPAILQLNTEQMNYHLQNKIK